MTASDKGLTSVQISRLEMISVNGSIYHKHAIALLAINNGVTQATAATTSGLTLNQVRYWLKKFRNQGLQAFPETVVDNQATPTANTKSSDAKPKKSKKEKEQKTAKDDKQKTKKMKKDKHKKTEKKKEKKNKKSKKKTKDKK